MPGSHIDLKTFLFRVLYITFMDNLAPTTDDVNLWQDLSVLVAYVIQPRFVSTMIWRLFLHSTAVVRHTSFFPAHNDDYGPRDPVMRPLTRLYNQIADSW